jgi:hypothetical protein
MAVTIFSYKDRHVPVPESPLIVVGYMLFHEARLNANTQEDQSRFQQMTAEFEISTIGVGCTDLALDRLLQGDLQKEVEFLAFVRLVRRRLLEFGKEVPVEYGNQVIAVHEPDWKDAVWPTPWLHKVLDIIEALIRDDRIPPPDWLTHFRRGTFPSNRSHRARYPR